MGQTSGKVSDARNRGRICLFSTTENKAPFVLKDDNSKFLVEVVFVISLYAVATVDFFHSKQ